jgi:hypothetical protein
MFLSFRWIMNNISTYLEKFGLISLEKQDKLAYLIGEHMYEFDLENGKIHFNDVEFPVQVLGTESDNTLTWLWAWADEQTEIAENLTTASRDLRDWGEQEGVQEFIVPSVDLNRADGHVFSIIASEVCKASCFYDDAYEGGALFMLIFDNRIDNQPSFDLTRLSKRLLYLISRYELNHRNILLSYFNMKGLIHIEHGHSISGSLETGELLSAEFDENGRLRSLNGERVEA